MDLAWMAWTWPTAVFFSCIALALLGMTLWQVIAPTEERASIFGIRTTRGDRFFVSLLGSAFIELAWIAWVGDLYIGSGVVCLLYTWAVFRWF